MVPCDNIKVDKVSLDDFEFELYLGKGLNGQSTIYKTKFKLNQKHYALKKINKDHIIKVRSACIKFQNNKQKNLIKEKKLI